MYDELNHKEPRIDWLMLAAIGGLMLIGVAFIFSASTAMVRRAGRATIG